MARKFKNNRFFITILILTLSILIYLLKPVNFYPFSPSNSWKMEAGNDTIFFRKYIISGYYSSDTGSLLKRSVTFLNTSLGDSLYKKTYSFYIDFYESDFSIDKDYIIPIEPSIIDNDFRKNELLKLSIIKGKVTEILFMNNGKDTFRKVLDESGSYSIIIYDKEGFLYKENKYSSNGKLIESNLINSK